MGKSLLKIDCESFIEEIEEGVDKRCWNCDKSQIEYSLNEYCFILLDDGFDYFPIKVGNIDTKECSEDEEDSQ